MDWPLDVMGSQLAQEWEALMAALAAVLAWTALLGVLVIAFGGVAAASCRAVWHRRFWCPSASRDVEVLFEEGGPPGFRQALRVIECSAFEPAFAVACRRDCKDATRRPRGRVLEAWKPMIRRERTDLPAGGSARPRVIVQTLAGRGLGARAAPR
jgi:hypothetical protein